MAEAAAAEDRPAFVLPARLHGRGRAGQVRGAHLRSASRRSRSSPCTRSFSRSFGEVYLPTSYGSLFAFFLLGAALLAVGMFVSSLTENQGLAAGVGIALVLFNYYSVSLSEYVSTSAHGQRHCPRRPRLPRGAAAQAPDGQRLARLLGRPRPRDAQRRALHPRAGVDRGASCPRLCRRSRSLSASTSS